MKELYEFKELISESEVVNGNDFGMHQNIGEKDILSGLSYVEQGLASIFADIAAHGKSDSQAKKIMNDAIQELIGQKVIDEIPNEQSSDGEKAMWLNHASPRIFAYLQLSGILM